MPKPLLVNVVFASLGCGDAILVCPTCGCDCVHPIAVGCCPPGSAGCSLVVVADGIHLDETAPAFGRGVMIEVWFRCEQDHVFGYAMHFHKGATTIERRHAESNADLRVIWRD